MSVESWYREADVVVAGYGYAAGVAAIAAHDLGAKVLLLEKMAHPGGNSILSGGFFRIANDADKAFALSKEVVSKHRAGMTLSMSSQRNLSTCRVS